MGKKLKSIIIRGFRVFAGLVRTVFSDFFHLFQFVYSPIALISGIGNYIAKSIRKYANGKPLRQAGLFIKSVLRKIGTDIYNFFKILYSPIRTIIAFGKNITDRIYSYAKNQYAKYINSIKLLFTHKLKQVFPGYNRRKFERLKKRLFLSKNETFLNSHTYAIVMVSTFALQCISFFTTFRGSLSFFEGVHWSAPILFTGVLQVLIWFLSNAAFSKRRRVPGRIIILVLLTCVSISLSYIGIANSSIPPAETYQSQYKTFKEAYVPLYDAIKSSAQGQDFTQQVNIVFDNIENTYRSAEELLRNLDNQIANSTPRRSLPNGVDSNGVPLYIPNPYYSDESNTFTVLQGRRSVLNNAMQGYTVETINDIRNQVLTLDTSSLKNSTDYNSAIETLQQNNADIFSNYASVSRANNALSKYLNVDHPELISSTEEDLVSLLGGASVVWNIDNLKLDEFSTIIQSANQSVAELDDNRPQAAKTFYEYILQGTERPQYTECVFQKTTDEINTKFDRMASSVETLGNAELSMLLNTLRKEKEKCQLQDPYTFAFSHILNTEKAGIGKLILMIFYAIFVDGMTVLIPLFVEKRRYSALFTKSSQDVFDEQEDVLENLLLSCAYPNSTSKLHDQTEEKVYQDMLKVLSEYVNLFEPSPFTMELGYPKRLKTDGVVPSNLTISSGGDVKDLTAFLLDMGYIKFVSRREYYLLKCEYYGITPYPNTVSAAQKAKKANHETGYYLMKSNFILWMNDNHFSWLGYNLATNLNNKNKNPDSQQRPGTSTASKSNQ